MWEAVPIKKVIQESFKELEKGCFKLQNRREIVKQRVRVEFHTKSMLLQQMFGTMDHIRNKISPEESCGHGDERKRGQNSPAFEFNGRTREK